MKLRRISKSGHTDDDDTDIDDDNNDTDDNNIDTEGWGMSMNPSILKMPSRTSPECVCVRSLARLGRSRFSAASKLDSLKVVDEFLVTLETVIQGQET